MKRILPLITAAIMMFSAAITVFADPNVNVDGGGGDKMGSGSGGSYWNNGNEGVRVTVVNTTDGSTVGSSVDFSNKNTGNVSVYGSGNKLDYSTGSRLHVQANGGYSAVNTHGTLPDIIKSDTSNPNIDEIRNYFKDEKTVNLISQQTGVDYYRLTSGDYTIAIEPVVYFTYNSMNYAMTATEMAKFDQNNSGALRSKFVSLMSSAALGMFLDSQDPNMPFGVYNGKTNGRVSNETILAMLGIGLISFDKKDKTPSDAKNNPQPEKVPDPKVEEVTEEEWHPQDKPSGATSVNLTANDYIYTVDTDVITAVSVSADDMVIGGGYVDFAIMGNIYRSANICMPAGAVQIAYVKWHTPSTPQNISINVQAGGGISSNSVTIHAAIVELKENTPPDPTAKKADQVHGFTIPTTYDRVRNEESITHNWSQWSCWWESEWRQEVSYRTEGPDENNVIKLIKHIDWIEFNGRYEFSQQNFNITVTNSTNIKPDELVPTAIDKDYGEYQMKSGYGFNIDTRANARGNYSIGMVGLTPNAIVTFPEFNYGTYNRVLERGDYDELFFKKNKYSTYNHRTHFTPLWFPDGTYRVLSTMQDIWTPCGEIRIKSTDTIEIVGNLYDDYYVHLVEED